MAVAEHRAAADRLDQGNFAKQEVLKVVPLHLSIFLQPAAELWRWGARNPYATASDALALVVFCSVVADEEADVDKGGSEVG